MTGRPGYRTMDMIGGSSVPYLACTPCVPLFCTLFNRGGNRRAFRLPGAGGGSCPLYGGTFAWSYFKFGVDLSDIEFSGVSALTLQSLLFSIALLFLFSDFPCFFGAFLLSFAGILGVPRREKPLLFWGKALAFPKKQGLEGQGGEFSGGSGDLGCQHFHNLGRWWYMW